MKKLISILLILCLMLTLAACGEKDDTSTPSGGVAVPPANDLAENTPKGEELSSLPDFFPQSFLLTTKTNMWSTELKLNSDGSFKGKYLEDANQNIEAHDYFGGMYMICEFEGKFGDFKKIDEFTYAMKLTELTPAYAPEEFFTENETLYQTAHPVGIDGGDWFYIYLPGKPTEGLDEAFTMWYMWADAIPSSLDRYGLYNPTSRYAFFAK